MDFAYGDVTGGITAGTNASLFTWGNVTSDIAAGTNVDVFARKNITANIAGLQSAKVIVGGNLTGNVSAGGIRDSPYYNATVNVVGNVTGDVKGSGNVSEDSLGNITGKATATTGAATVYALGDYTGQVNSKTNSTVTVGGNISSSTVGRTVMCKSPHTAASLMSQSTRTKMLSSRGIKKSQRDRHQRPHCKHRGVD